MGALCLVDLAGAGAGGSAGSDSLEMTENVKKNEQSAERGAEISACWGSLLTWRRYEGRGFSPFSRDLIWLGVRDWKSDCSLSSLDRSELIFQKDDDSSGLRASLTETFGTLMMMMKMAIRERAVLRCDGYGTLCVLPWVLA